MRKNYKMNKKCRSFYQEKVAALEKDAPRLRSKEIQARQNAIQKEANAFQAKVTAIQKREADFAKKQKPSRNVQMNSKNVLNKQIKKMVALTHKKRKNKRLMK